MFGGDSHDFIEIPTRDTRSDAISASGKIFPCGLFFPGKVQSSSRASDFKSGFFIIPIPARRTFLTNSNQMLYRKVAASNSPTHELIN